METLISPIPLLTACLFIIAILGIAYLCWRARSLHFLLRRFWLLVHGNKDIPDPQIQAFAQEQTSLYAFRLFSGTQVQSLAQAHQLIAWSEKHQVPMTTISACGDCFDLEHHKVLTEKLPGKLYRIALFLWLCTLIVCIGLAIFISTTKPGLAILKSSERWIILNENRVERAFAWPFITPSLNIGDCQEKNSDRLQATGFVAAEIESICNLLSTKEWTEYVSKTKKDIQKQCFELIIICFICFVIFIPSINKQYHARELHKKLTSTKEKEIEYTTT